MIKLDTSTDDFFLEGRLGDILKKHADVDVDEIKKVWEDSDTSDEDKLNVLNNKGIQRVNDKLENINKKIASNVVNNPSIIARAKNSVLQFPVYITQSIRVNEAHIIGKMFERVYATFVQTVLSHNAALTEEEAKNLVFLKGFHTNLKESAEVLVNKYYEAIDDIDKMMCESVFHTMKLTDDCYVEFRVVPSTDETLIMENARLANEPLRGFAYLKESDEKEKDGNKDNIAKISQRKPGSPERILQNSELQSIADGNDDINGDIGKLKELINAGKKIAYRGGEIFARKNNKGRIEYYVSGTDGDTITRENETAVEAPKLLKDSDIKKMNGMLPYTIEATFRIRSGTGLYKDVRFIIGIKTIMHLISVKDLGEDLRDIITGNIKTLQKVRYKTGEISFKDYIFNIKGLKADAAKHINYDKRWLNTLKRLGEYEKMNGTALRKGISAITGRC